MRLTKRREFPRRHRVRVHLILIAHREDAAVERAQLVHVAIVHRIEAHLEHCCRLAVHRRHTCDEGGRRPPHSPPAWRHSNARRPAAHLCALALARALVRLRRPEFARREATCLYPLTPTTFSASPATRASGSADGAPACSTPSGAHAHARAGMRARPTLRTNLGLTTSKTCICLQHSPAEHVWVAIASRHHLCIHCDLISQSHVWGRAAISDAMHRGALPSRIDGENAACLRFDGARSAPARELVCVCVGGVGSGSAPTPGGSGAEAGGALGGPQGLREALEACRQRAGSRVGEGGATAPAAPATPARG